MAGAFYKRSQIFWPMYLIDYFVTVFFHDNDMIWELLLVIIKVTK